MPLTLPVLDIASALAGYLAGKPHAVAEAVGPWGAAKALVALQTAQALTRPLLLIAAGRIEAEAIHDDLCTYAGAESVVYLPSWEVLPSDKMTPADDIVAERMAALRRLNAAADSGEHLHTVLPVRSLLQYVANRKRLAADTIGLTVGEEYDLEDLLLRLTRLGYRREVMVEQRGEMSVRGGIFDIFPISAELPYRIEFFGDEVESIRRFEPETQRSVDTLETVHVLPRSEQALLAGQVGINQLQSVLKYLPDNILIAVDEPMMVQEEGIRLSEQFGDSPYLMPWEEAETQLSKRGGLRLAQVAYDKAKGVERVTQSMHALSGWPGSAEGFWDQLQLWDSEGYTVQLLCNNTGERRRLMELLEERGYRLGEDAFDLRVGIGTLSKGFASAADRLALLSEHEIFGRRYVRRTRKRFQAGATITAFSDLKAGDYIVHAVHGIGRYMGLKRFSGKSGDFVAITYAGGDTFYVPVTHIDQIHKYVGGDGAVPKMDKLGGKTWARTKAKVKKAVRDMTDELVKLYAARETQEGHACMPDTPWQREFEEAFPYDETPDQARAIAEMKRDLESVRPMDRLLCGDVGFGKTEVALRAVFKVIQEGRQVAMLVPTTILTEQHFETFRERMADFPVTVAHLDRFVSAARQREVIDKLKSGEIDVVIGTHRILSKDIGFKNLGLVIIDEEQRFGVAQKERLKKMRTSVDVLTLSATPIPRTLNMSMVGVRDMSVINTAPNDRLPIHTCIETYSDDLVQEALRRELGRKGQVYYLHNSVKSILSVAEKLKQLVPEARVGIGHGQMPEHQLEEVMTAFIRHEIDILVCTTIIGTGLDIPNANTIIVDRADTFGLSQLYQIRGRVGRYKHRAFAYLLIPGDRALSEEAQKRLNALQEFSTLGSGFRVAMRDLEIRGCGNILGGEQSGNIASVGYDTYNQLIAEAVAELRGQPRRHIVLPSFDITVEASIPDSYVPSESQKVTLYKRITGIQSVDDVDEMAEELKDRFGAPPTPVKRLLDVMRVRALGAEAGVLAIVGGRDSVEVQFQGTLAEAQGTYRQLVEKFGRRLEPIAGDLPGLRLSVEDGDALKSARDLMEALYEAV